LGHTDRQGTSSYNEGLSKKRAESVASRLREKFDISSDAIEIKALGESKLLNPGKNDIQRAKNRRVVLRMIEN
jgi:OOP family OmpA-OmpF porin